MAKRFCDTELWEKSWYRKLPCKHKLLFNFLFQKCDIAGFINFDPELASFYIGEIVRKEDLNLLGEHVIQVDRDKYYLKDFISFQYGKLSNKSKPHIAVINKIEKHGFSDIDLIGYPKGINTLKDQDKDQDQEKDKDKDKDNSEKSKLLNNVLNIWNSKITSGEILGVPRSRIMISGKPTSDFLEASNVFSNIEQWETILNNAAESDYLSGRNKKTTPRIEWFFNYDNALKVHDGFYANREDSKTADPNSTREKGIRDYMNIGMSREEAEKEYDELIAKARGYKHG